MSYYGFPEDQQIPPQPPYNATNFTPANAVIYNTMVNNAKTQPNYPLNQGSDSDQINRQRQNVSYFASLQQQTQNGTKPFPAFVLDQRRLMYIQGQYATASRNIITKENTSGPAGVPFFTLPSAPTLVSAIQGFYGIIVTFTGPVFTFTSPNQACESQIISYQIRLSNSTDNGTNIINNVYGSPYTITGITSQTSYQLTIAAVNAGGVGLLSNSLASYVIPSPTEFQVIPTGASGTVTLYFNEAITAFNTGIYTIFEYYIVAVKDSDQTVQQYFYTPTDNTATSYVYTITNLTDGVDYTFYIFARINPSTPQSGYAVKYEPTVTPYGPPLAPIIISVTVPPGDDFIVVFQQPINGLNAGNNQVTGYTIVVTHTNTGISYPHPVSAITDSGSITLTYATSFEGGLVLGVTTPYTMVIFATNAAGTTSSATYSGTATRTTSSGGRVPVTTPPSSPILTVQTSINTVYLSFIQGSTGGLQVFYQYSKNGIYTSFTPTSTGFSYYYYKITNVAAGTYTFAVKATNNRGFSVSNNVTVTVQSAATLQPISQRLRLLLRR